MKYRRVFAIIPVMKFEVEQPAHLARPDLSGSFTWMVIPMLKSEWLRHVIPQIEQNTQKIIMGYTLAIITEDDEYAFGSSYSADLAWTAKSQIFFRMDWELGLPELVPAVKDRIAQIKAQMEKMEWEGEENYEKVKSLWMSEVRDFTRLQVESDPKLNEAFIYEQALFSLLTPLWADFLLERG